MSGIGWSLTSQDHDGGDDSGWGEAAMSGRLVGGGGGGGAAKLATWALGKVLGKEKGPPDEESLFACKYATPVANPAGTYLENIATARGHPLPHRLTP